MTTPQFAVLVLIAILVVAVNLLALAFHSKMKAAVPMRPLNKPSTPKRNGPTQPQPSPKPAQTQGAPTHHPPPSPLPRAA